MEYVKKKSKEYEIANPDKFKEHKELLEKQAALEKKKKKKKKKKECFEEKLLNKFIFFEFDIVIFELIL